MTVTLRPVTPADAGVLADLYRANREFLAPWEPLRSAEFFTEDYQREWLRDAVARQAAGTACQLMIMEAGQPVGRITINDIVRGPFESAHLGYWVAAAVNGRGVATAAVAGVLRIAFDDLGLHRLQAGTLTHNLGSQRVLTRNGFEPIGVAPAYLRIAGRWQDHLLFQRIREDRPDEVRASR